MNAPHPQPSASELVARTLVAGLAVRHAVVSPGSRSTPLALALANASQIDVHVVLDERSAGFVALGLARATGEPTALLCTSGSAAGHYLPAVMEASQARVPLLVISADRPRELHDCGAPQTAPQRDLFGGYARRSFDVPAGDVSPRWVRAVAAQARNASLASPPGPVHLNVAFREPLYLPSEPVRATNRLDRTALAAARPVRTLRATAQLPWDAVDALDDALDVECGVIVCGPHASPTVSQRDLACAIDQLSQRLQWPVLAEAASGLFFPRIDNLVSRADVLLRSDALAQLRPQTVLRFGTTPTSKPLRNWLAAQPGHIAIDADGQWHDPDCRIDTMVVADPIATCNTLASRPPRQQGAWLDRWMTAERTANVKLVDLLAAEWWEGAIAHTVAATIPDGATLHLASSMPIRDFDAFAAADANKTVDIHASRGCNGIDGTIATAHGEALAAGRTFALVGDLAFLHDIGSLRLRGAELTVVVIDNGGGGIFEYLPIREHDGETYERFFLTPQSQDLAALCRAAGARHVRVTNRHDLEAALRQRSDTLNVIEAGVDRAHNVHCHQLAWQRIARAFGGVAQGAHS